LYLLRYGLPCLLQPRRIARNGATSEAAPFGPPIDDQHVWYHAIANQLEGRFGRENGFRWDGEAWAGTDSNRLWLKSEGLLNDNGKLEDGSYELLYDRPITSFFDLQAGLRTDADSRSGRSWAALGVEGLAPLFFPCFGHWLCQQQRPLCCTDGRQL
jgi:copper resistance protein B